MKTNTTKTDRRPKAEAGGNNPWTINALTESVAADSVKALRMLTRRF